MTRLAKIIAMCIATATPAVATALVVSENVDYFDKSQAHRESVCQSQAAKILEKRFENVSEPNVTSSNFWNSVVQNVETYGFPNSVIQKDGAPIQTDILCMVLVPQNLIVEMSFQFDQALKTKGASRYVSGASFFVSQPNFLIPPG